MVLTMTVYMHVRSQKYGHFAGHWLSDINTIEVKNFDIQSSYAVLSITNQTFQRNPKMLTFDFSGRQIYLRPGKVPFATVPNIRLAR